MQGFGTPGSLSYRKRILGQSPGLWQWQPDAPQVKSNVTNTTRSRVLLLLLVEWATMGQWGRRTTITLFLWSSPCRDMWWRASDNRSASPSSHPPPPTQPDCLVPGQSCPTAAGGWPSGCALVVCRWENAWKPLPTTSLKTLTHGLLVCFPIFLTILLWQSGT